MTLITPPSKIVDGNGDMMPRMEAWVELVSGRDDLTIPLIILNGGTGADNEADARTNLGLEIGVDVSTIIDVQDDAVSISNPANTLNFTGSGVVVTEGPAGQANIDIVGGGGGVTTFDALTDTPASKVSFALDFVRVNAGETDLEYHTIVPADIGAEPSFSKNTAFNKDFGTSAGTVLEGDTAFQPLDAGLTSIAGLVTSADKMIYTTASDVYAATDLTALARSLMADATQGAMQTTLGLVIGTDVQAWSSNLDSINQDLGTAANVQHNSIIVRNVSDLTSSGARQLKLGQIGGSFNSTSDCFIGPNVVGGPGGSAGDLLQAPASNVNASIRMFTGNPTLTERFSINDGGVGDFAKRFRFNDPTNSTSAISNATVKIAGGISVALRGNFGEELTVDGTTAKILSGSGSPEGSITAVIGSRYSRTDGGAGTSQYKKESGAGNTGWVAY